MLRLETRDVTAGYRVSVPTPFGASTVTCTRADTGTGRHAVASREAGLSVVEVPVAFVERVRGRSKMRPAIVVEAAGRVTAWGLGLRFGRRAAMKPADGAGRLSTARRLRA